MPLHTISIKNIALFVFVIVQFQNSNLFAQATKNTTGEPVKLKTSLNAYSFNESLSKGTMNVFDLIDYCKKTGFDAVDITAYYFPGYPEVPSDEYLYKVKQKAFLSGIEISGTGVRTNFTSTDPEIRKKSIELVKKWVIAAEKMGAPIIRIFAGEALPKDYSITEVTNYMIEDLKECVAFGKQHGVIIGIQNHWDFIKDGTQTLDILQRIDSEWFGLILDIGSFKSGNPYTQIEETMPYAVSWQLKEVKTDLEKLMKIISKSGYQGYIPIETLGKGDPKLKVEKFFAQVNKAIKTIK
jgi:sugar phosphate isomerase/epimerase